MRTPNLGSVGYSPNLPPEKPEELSRFVFDELGKIAAAITALAQGHIDISYAAPSKPRAGDLRYADGTTWNPGSGAGIYRYTGSAWVFVG